MLGLKSPKALVVTKLLVSHDLLLELITLTDCVTPLRWKIFWSLIMIAVVTCHNHSFYTN